MPDEPNHCSLCGRPLPEPGGHCPQCLFSFAEGSELGDFSSEELLTPAQLRYFGDYELECEISRGGMGVVYRARQVSLNRPVAIKMILAGQLANPESIARFKVEAEAAANLDHPNIVPVFEIGEFEMQHYFSMKLIEDARHVSRWAEDHANCKDGLRVIASVLEKVASAIGYAHERGLLHRDVKPSNILVDGSGEPHLTDFGLAKLADSEHSILTLSSTALGSPAFMAPEQAGGEATIASDVYGLGAVLYHMLTGVPPFQGKTALETMQFAAENVPRPPRQLNALVSEDLQTICLKCLEKDPAQRYLSARELADDLDRFGRGEPVTARPVGTLGKVARWWRRNPALATTALIASLAMVVGAVGVVWQWREAQAARVIAEAERDDARWDSYRAIMMGVSSALELNQGEHLRQALLSAPPEHRNWEWHYFGQSLDQWSKTFTFEHPQTEWERLAFGSDSLVGITRTRSPEEDGVASVWDVNTGENKEFPANLLFDQKLKRSVEIKPDGSCVVTELASGEQIVNVPPPAGTHSKSHLHFLADGDFVVVDSVDRFTIIDVRSGNATPVLSAGNGYAHSFLLLKGSNRLLAVRNEFLIIHDSRTGEELVRWTHENTFRSIALSPDESLIAAGERYPDSDIQLLSPETGEVLARLRGHTNTVHTLQFDPSGSRLLSASYDRTPRLWDVAKQSEIASLRGHVGQVRATSFNADASQIATASADETFRLWDGFTGKPLRVLRSRTIPSHLAFSPDGNLLATHDTHAIKIWDIDPDTSEVLRGHQGAIYDVAISPDGTEIASASWDSTARTWNLARRKQNRSIELVWKGVGVAYSPDGQYLATSSRSKLRCWRRSDAEQIFEVALGARIPHQHLSIVPDFSPDSKRVLTVFDGGVHVFDVPGGEKLVSLPTDTWIYAATFSPDGAQIAAACYGTVRIWDAETSAHIADLRSDGDFREMTCVAYSPCGKFIASAGGSAGVTLWDVTTHQQIAGLPPSGRVYALVFSPDSSRCFTACDDGQIRIWDVPTLDQVGSLYAHSSYAHGIAMSADGRTLVSGGGDGRLRIWEIDSQE